MSRRPHVLLALFVAVAALLVLVLVPVPTASADCASCWQGTCNATTPSCACSLGYTGVNCDQCNDNFTLTPVSGWPLPNNVSDYTNPDITASNTLMNVTDCLVLCQDYNFAGLLQGYQCWCGGSTYALYGATPNANACNISCTGDSSSICGGEDALTVYLVTSALLTSPQYHMGCFYFLPNATLCTNTNPAPSNDPGQSTPTPIIDANYAQRVLIIVFSIICVIFGAAVIFTLYRYCKKSREKHAKEKKAKERKAQRSSQAQQQRHHNHQQQHMELNPA